MNPIRVFIDTNVLKFSVTESQRLVPRIQKLNWGGRPAEVVVHDEMTINWNDRIMDPVLKSEVELLPKLAELGRANRLQFLLSVETKVESWCLPKRDSVHGICFGAPIKSVQAPVMYGRVVVGMGVDLEKEQFRFLASLKAPRFLQLQRMTGAYQGPGRLNRNQLLDACHLWGAEYNQCSYFLTLDFKLARVLRRSANSLLTHVVKPSDLMTLLREI